jgi:hypothetical protein
MDKWVQTGIVIFISGLVEKRENRDTRYFSTCVPKSGRLRFLPAGDDFLKVQDEYLTELIAEHGVVDASSLIATASDPRIAVWRGDITTLKIDAIVNAANSRMEGCWEPCHACIDNCIHTYSGVQLRMRCHELMAEQGHEADRAGKDHARLQSSRKICTSHCRPNNKARTFKTRL